MDRPLRAATDLNEANRLVFDEPAVVASFATGERWNNPGERAAVLAAAPACRGRRVLDVGVGAGRTVGLLRLLSDDYVGVDYSPRMVERAVAANPGVDLRVDDARALRTLGDGEVAMAFVSDNALDSLDRRGRSEALRSLARVLEPGGALVLSTHNLAPGGPPRARPWHRYHRATDGGRLRRAVEGALLLGRDLRHLPARSRNWAANRRLAGAGEGWAMVPLAALDFALVAHMTSVGGLVRDLAAAGFEAEAVWDAETGGLVDPAEEHAPSVLLYALARRRR